MKTVAAASVGTVCTWHGTVCTWHGLYSYVVAARLIQFVMCVYKGRGVNNNLLSPRIKVLFIKLLFAKYS